MTFVMQFSRPFLNKLPRDKKASYAGFFYAWLTAHDLNQRKYDKSKPDFVWVRKPA